MLTPQLHDYMRPVHPCHFMPTRHCPAALGSCCEPERCARFHLDEAEALKLWDQELPDGLRHESRG